MGLVDEALVQLHGEDGELGGNRRHDALGQRAAPVRQVARRCECGVVTGPIVGGRVFEAPAAGSAGDVCLRRVAVVVG